MQVTGGDQRADGNQRHPEGQAQPRAGRALSADGIGLQDEHVQQAYCQAWDDRVAITTDQVLFEVGLILAGRRYAAGGTISTRPAHGGIPTGSDLLFLVRANGTLAPVTRTSALAAEDGDTMVLFGPAADS